MVPGPNNTHLGKCFIYFPITVLEYPDRGNLKGKRLILVHGSELQPTMAGRQRGMVVVEQQLTPHPESGSRGQYMCLLGSLPLSHPGSSTANSAPVFSPQ